MGQKANIWDNDPASFLARYPCDEHLACSLAKGLLKADGRELVVDCTQGRRALNGATLFALGMELAGLVRTATQRKRVGIVLPPGAGGALANIACLFADKVPVNLNFTLGREGLESSVRRAGLDCMITAPAMREKVPHLPAVDQMLDVGEMIQSIPRWRIARWLIAAKLLPRSAVLKLASLPRVGGEREAALLFTSGSSGEPKGVPLTHRNILGNVYQIVDYDVLHTGDTILGCLPIFHSFGFTVTVCFTLTRGMRTVYLPSPLETGRIVEAIEREQVTVHVCTPTLLRPYFKKAKREQLRSLRAVIAGAEKTPEGFHAKWEEHFGSHYLEGYGLTETTPVVACNMPDEGKRRGSVGRLFPGMIACIHDPDTQEPQPYAKTGLLGLKGVNVFAGYMDDDSENAASFRNGWFVTGDLARLDDDGFLYIEGRLSRFSKIGGEMVPHGTVEKIIAHALGRDDAEHPELAVSARSDEAKGEVLVLLVTFPLEMQDLRQSLKGHPEELPGLWMPREIRQVEALPLLASGKLDLKALKQLAQ